MGTWGGVGRPAHFILYPNNSRSRIKERPMREEIWKDIAGYEGLYKISNFGRIKNKENKIKAQSPQNGGYLVVHLYNHGSHKAKTVHRLVASTFIPNDDEKSEVNHIDGDKRNNKIENLEWVTPKENQCHSRIILGNICGRKNKKIKCVETGEMFLSTGEASRSKGIAQSDICRCANKTRGRKSAGGYHWEYAN